uniref:Espin like a n=1 Tax=Electrophorus electricus TaxID=8005 RepID=A0A4W4EET7_ELEEL
MVLQQAVAAARAGDLERLRPLATAGHLTAAGPVHHAARFGQLDCLRALNGATPLHDTAATGHACEVQWLVQCAACSVQEQDATGAPALHLAARFGKAEVVHWLLAFGGRADQETNCGAFPAHYAAAKDDLACLKLLIGQAPGCVNRQTLIGATPVYLACQEGHLHMLEYLVKDCGADVHLRAKDGMTSLHTAAHMGHHSLVVWLASFTDISLNSQDIEGATALHYAVIKDYWGGTPLHDAAENAMLECCRVLVQHSLRPSEKDVDGFTVANLAEYNAHYECARYQRLAGRNVRPSKMVVLPTEEANLCDIDYLVPTHDEKGRPIAEWKRQVMVRQLQARLLDDEAQRRRVKILPNGSRYAKMDSWRYSQAHNAILGPFGELLTEDDLIYLEKQIKSVSMQKHCEGYEVELARLAEELRNILPAPIVNITVNTQYRNPNTQIPLPVWCNRISGIVKSMSLLLTNLTDEPYCKMLNTELVTVFSQNFERQNLARGRREQIENEIHKFGVSVCNLKSNFENQGPPTAMHPESTKPPAPEEEPPGGDSGRASEDHDLEPEAEQNDSGLDYHEVTDVMESTSLRKERIVVLFLGHWKKSAYTVTMKNAQRKLSMDSLEMTDRSKIQRKASLDISPKKMMENGSLGQFFKQRSAINKMIGNWRSMISIVPSRQIRRLGRQQALYSPEQFLPRMGGAPVEYDALTLDLFMLGYFHILEQDLLSDERKMRHLLCFEVFDHVGRFSWETVRDFHKAVIQDIEAGNREWRDGFEDVKVRFFGQASDQPEARDPDKSPTVEARPVPKVVVQSPTPDEGDPLNRSSDISSLSNDEICKYIDRSFAFWKEKEAELFDFE